ncbi:MAG: hypothetical protein KUG77_14710 [Nannocystaceae bacterium]|nr:hypothetical protein [Nannocystaceae bacterium]
MNDDLLSQLGALQRDRDADQEEWEAVARGDVSTATLAEARVAAAADHEQVQQLAAVLEPNADLERWVEIGLTATRSGSDPTNTTESAPTPWRRPSVFGWGAAVAVLAAALVLLWATPPAPSPDAELPAYTLMVRNETIRSQRGHPTPEAVYRPSSTTEWVIRPDHATDLAREISILARSEGAAPQLLFPPKHATHITDDGVVQLRGSFGSLVPLQPGRWELQMIVGSRRPADIAELERGGPWEMTAPTAVNIIP